MQYATKSISPPPASSVLKYVDGKPVFNRSLEIGLRPVLFKFLPIKVCVEILKVDFLSEVGMCSLFPVFLFVVLTVIEKYIFR